MRAEKLCQELALKQVQQLRMQGKQKERQWNRKRQWQEKRRNHRFMNAWQSIRESSRKNREKISRREGLI